MSTPSETAHPPLAPDNPLHSTVRLGRDLAWNHRFPSPWQRHLRPCKSVAGCVLAAVCKLALAQGADTGWMQLEYSPAPPDNPLKGFVPYAGQAREFPHSMEFRYFALRELLPSPDQFDWSPVDRFLEEVAQRGCQGIFRVWLEYPGRPSGLPRWLLESGVQLTQYAHEQKITLTPDYTHPAVRRAMVTTIQALGARYDSDSRVAYITAGFLGQWGEWHTYPRDDLWAPKAVQEEIMNAYERSFRRVPILLRYPAGEQDPHYAPNHRRPFGYHDDSFAWATLETGRKAEDWFFMARMRRAGPEAMEKWKTHPIGGEVRPELWPVLWASPSGNRKGQDFLHCVEVTHATWLMDSSIARRWSPEERERAIAGARRLGYEFHVARARLWRTESGACGVAIELVNRGVAPFYAEWPMELAILDREGQPLAQWHPSGWSLRGLLPHDPPRQLESTSSAPVPVGGVYAALRVPNPMPRGRPVRFANRSQRSDESGWLLLGELPR